MCCNVGHLKRWRELLLNMQGLLCNGSYIVHLEPWIIALLCKCCCSLCKGCCAGSFPDCAEQRPLPPLPEGPKLVPAPHVLLWCVGLHCGSHHHPNVHCHPPGKHYTLRPVKADIMLWSRSAWPCYDFSGRHYVLRYMLSQGIALL